MQNPGEDGCLDAPSGPAPPAECSSGNVIVDKDHLVVPGGAESGEVEVGIVGEEPVAELGVLFTELGKEVPNTFVKGLGRGFDELEVGCPGALLGGGCVRG